MDKQSQPNHWLTQFADIIIGGYAIRDKREIKKPWHLIEIDHENKIIYKGWFFNTLSRPAQDIFLFDAVTRLNHPEYKSISAGENTIDLITNDSMYQLNKFHDTKNTIYYNEITELRHYITSLCNAIDESLNEEYIYSY